MAAEPSREPTWLKPHHFQPGQSGNPRGTRSDREFVRHVLSQTRGGKELAEICLTIARDTRRKARDRLLAIQLMTDRVWGKAPLSIDVQKHEDGRFSLNDIQVARDLLAERDRLRDEVRRQASEPETVIETTAEVTAPPTAHQITMQQLEQARASLNLTQGSSKPDPD